MEWPKQNDKLVRPDTDYHLNACINSYQLSLSQVATSYNVPVEGLARAAAEGDAILPLVVLPLVFLYRQYLELSMKDIIETGRLIEREGDGYAKRDNLLNLCAEAKRLLKKHYLKGAPKNFIMSSPVSGGFIITIPSPCPSDTQRVRKEAQIYVKSGTSISAIFARRWNI